MSGGLSHSRHMRQAYCEVCCSACAGLCVHVYHGRGKAGSAEELACYGVVLTTYTTMALEAPSRQLHGSRGKARAPIDLCETSTDDEQPAHAGGSCAEGATKRSQELRYSPAKFSACALAGVQKQRMHGVLRTGCSDGPGAQPYVMYNIIVFAEWKIIPVSVLQKGRKRGRRARRGEGAARRARCLRCVGTGWCWTRHRASRTRRRSPATPPGPSRYAPHSLYSLQKANLACRGSAHSLC